MNRTACFWGALVVFVTFFGLYLEIESKPVAKKSAFSVKITLETPKIPVDKQVIYGSITLSNHSEKALEVVSKGCWLQFVDFHFFDGSGKLIGKSNYGDQFYLHPLESVKESIPPAQAADSSVAPRPPSKLAPGIYFVEASFDYEETHLRSNRLQFTIVAK